MLYEVITGSYVFFDPLKCLDLIENAKISRGVQFIFIIPKSRVRQPTKRAQAVLDNHHNDVLTFGQCRPVVALGTAENIGSAVKPYVDGNIFIIRVRTVNIYSYNFV